MNQNNLQYFSDLKFFFKHLRNYYILFSLLIIISLILGYLKFNLDTENTQIETVNKIVLEKKIFKSYEFYSENYELKSQVYPFTKIYDLYDMTFNLINENVLKLRDKKKSNFSLNKYNNNNTIIYEFKNAGLSMDDINRISNNVKNEIKDKINDYKKIEISKININLNNFLYDIVNNRNYSDIFQYDEIHEFRELLIDAEYRKIFEESVKNHFHQLCQTLDYKNDIYCKYNKFEEYDFILQSNISICEIASKNYDYRVIISSILKNKINCYNGFQISEKTIFFPLEEFLKHIMFFDLLYDIYLEKDNLEINKPILIIYLLYSIILGFFISIIISFFHSLYKHKK